MCGVLGLVAASEAPIDREWFLAALRRMSHRGPDGEGLYESVVRGRRVVLGHRRLAIIDPSDRAAQPMHSRDGRYVISYNGEILNFRELGADLNVELHSNSDTEVLLELYAQRGPELFRSLRGMFALAILDRITGEVVLARDHLGIKPLYFARLEDGFVFASEVKSLLALGVPAKLRKEFLGEYLAQSWVQEPDTLFEGISKVRSGAWVSFRDGKISETIFWDLAPRIREVSERRALDELGTLVEDSVRSHMISDRPLGSYLSGGVDSSIVTHLAAREMPNLVAVNARFRTIDRVYEGLEDDGRWADAFARDHPRLRYHTLEMEADLYDTYRSLVFTMDEPIADAAVVPAFLLATKARAAGAVVMLSGMGADELFGGYGRYAGVEGLSALGALPRVARRVGLLGATVAQRFVTGAGLRRASHAERLLHASLAEWPLGYVCMGHFGLEEIDGLAGPEWRGPCEAKLRATLTGFEHSSRVTQAQRLDLKGFLASHNLIYSDKAAMRASVEVRFPLIDPALAEFAFTLPDPLKVSLVGRKKLLKRYCAENVGRGYAYRTKAGFAMPIRSWMRSTLRGAVERALLHGRVAELFDGSRLAALVDDHYAGRRENTWKLWTLLNLDLWLETFNVRV